MIAHKILKVSRMMLTMLSIVTFSALAQQKQAKQELKDEEDFKFQFNTDILLYSYDFLKQKVYHDTTHIGRYGWWFYRIGSIRNDDSLGQIYVIRLSQFKSRSIKKTSDNANNDELRKQDAEFQKLDSVFNNRYFAVRVEEFLDETRIIKRYSTWKALPSIGALVIPIKLRPGTKNNESEVSVPFDFSQDFTIGTSVGVRFRISRYKPNYFNILGSVGITSALVDSVSTNGIVTKSNSKISAFTPSLGLLLEFSGVQIGGFVGWDFAGRSIAKNWDYHGKSWVAVGVGYQIISRNKED